MATSTSYTPHLTNLIAGVVTLGGAVFAWLVALGVVGIGVLAVLASATTFGLLMLVGGIILVIAAVLETEAFGHHGFLLDHVNWLLPLFGVLAVFISVLIAGLSVAAAIVGVVVGILLILDGAVAHEAKARSDPGGLLGVLSEV